MARILRTCLWCFFFLAALAPGFALACPDIDGLFDTNCDGDLIIVTFGDSITAGVGDSADLGYPGRMNLLFPTAHIFNLGDPGENTSDGRSRASNSFIRYPDADYIIILEGVNDYWTEDRSSSRTKSNLLAMVASGEHTGAITLLARLTGVRRSYQRPWVRSVNSAISPFASIDFYILGEGIIGHDDLHPDDYGYNQMAGFAANRLVDIARSYRPIDSDNDELFDYEEPSYGSNVFNPDSDGDGLLDGSEVFRFKSSPLIVDTDGDGFTDFQEVSVGANPASPLPTPPTVQTLIIPTT